MYVYICSVQIAKGFVDPISRRFVHIPAVLVPETFHGDSEAKLKGHIEAWSTRVIPIQFDPGKVMDRVVALLEQCENPLQPALTRWNFQRGAWDQRKGSQPGDIGEI
jgi:hypothetical protein